MTRKIRVLFALGSLAGGGAERQTINYLRFLDRQRFEPLLYLHQREGELINDVPDDVPVIAFWDRHKPPRLNYPGRIRRWQIRDLERVVLEQQIDVVCSVAFLMTLVTAPATNRQKIPWLAVEMADPRLDFANQTSRFRRLKHYLLRNAYRDATTTVAVSEGVREGLVKTYDLPTSDIVVVANSVDLEQVDRMAAESGPELESGKFHIAVVGRLNVQKGHVYLLQSLRELVHTHGERGVRLHLLGQGPLEADLRSFCSEAGLMEYVDFTGFVPNAPAYISRCDLFCMPSLYEGLPLAMLEALACRVPVLATDCPSGPAEVLVDGRYGELVPPSDPAALVTAIRDAIQNQTRWQSRAELGRQHVEQKYAAHHLITSLEDQLALAVVEPG